VFSGLQLGGALDDALQRLTTDEVSAPFLGHQTFALPLVRGAGRRSPAVRSGEPGCLNHWPAPCQALHEALERSIGIGKIVVELFSEAIR